MAHSANSCWFLFCDLEFGFVWCSNTIEMYTVTTHSEWSGESASESHPEDIF